MAYFCGHVMPWEQDGVVYLISIESRRELLSSFVFLNLRDDVSAEAPWSQNTPHSECMGGAADLHYIVLMKSSLEDLFSQLTHTRRLKGLLVA